MAERLTGEEFANHFSNFMNSFVREQHKVAVERMARDHRSIQQCYMRFFMQFAEKLAANTTDDRNAAAVALAKAIMALPEAQKGLPLI